MRCFRKICVLIVIMCLLLPQLAIAHDDIVEPLTVGRKVKIYYGNNESIKGYLRAWELHNVIVETGIGVINIDPNKITKAAYVLDDSDESSTMPAIIEGKSSAPNEKKGLEASLPVNTKLVNGNNDEEKQLWQERLDNAKSTRTLLIVLGIAACAAGAGELAAGTNEIANAKMVVTVNSSQGHYSGYVTNQSDIDDGNTKVLLGSIIILGGVLLIVIGAGKNRDIKAMEYRGKQKGFIVRYNKYPELAYSYSF